jgi:hypothetical protein
MVNVCRWEARTFLPVIIRDAAGVNLRCKIAMPHESMLRASAFSHSQDPLRSLQIGPSFPFAAWGLAMPDTITLELSKDEALVLFE